MINPLVLQKSHDLSIVISRPVSEFTVWASVVGDCFLGIWSGYTVPGPLDWLLWLLGQQLDLGVALAGKVLSFLDVDLEAKLGGSSGDPVHQTLNVTNTVGNYSTITCKQHFPH